MNLLPPSTPGLALTARNSICNISKLTTTREEIFNGSQDTPPLSTESFSPSEAPATLPTGYPIFQPIWFHIPNATTAKFTVDSTQPGKMPKIQSWPTYRTSESCIEELLSTSLAIVWEEP